jgi:hypothetical protein
VFAKEKMTHIYDRPDHMPPVDDLSICIALLQGAKIRAEKSISNPWGQSNLDRAEQQLMDKASAAIEEAVLAIETLRNSVKVCNTSY